MEYFATMLSMHECISSYSLFKEINLPTSEGKTQKKFCTSLHNKLTF